MGARKLYEDEIKKFIETSKDEDLAKIVFMIKTLEEKIKNSFAMAIEEAFGKFAHVKTSSEEFAKRKQEENRNEYLSLDEKIALTHNIFKNYKGSSDAFMSSKAIEKMLDR
ncbi:MAG: hypothetical protein H7101_11425 [Deinococcales bacterium]|nr:hypothetical protein [Chitinophagaceae bacterium]